MYEHRTHHLLSRVAFARRVAFHWILALLVIGAGLGIGVVGYHYLGKLAWLDALLNASMILSGMGPVDPLQTPAATQFLGSVDCSCSMVYQDGAYAKNAGRKALPTQTRPR